MSANPMRIMLIVNEFPPEKIAGTAMATQALAEHLAARGHQVLVLVTTTCPVDRQNQICSGAYELIWTPPRPLRGAGIFWRTWFAWKYARCFTPQLIQGQAVSCGLIAAVVGKLMHVPSICYAQGYDVYEATAWQRLTEVRWGCRWPNRLLAVSRHLAETIRRVCGISDVQLMPHAFTLPERKPVREDARGRCELSKNDRVVLSIGRLETFKGHDVLLNAWVGFVQHHPEADLWIAGTGSKMQTLQQQAVDLGVDQSVHFAGYLTTDEVHQWMAAADLFVLPSRSEPFGIVLLEAMVHGLPVVATDVGGIPEVVPEAGDVRLVHADDAESLQAAMLDMFPEIFACSETNRQHAMNFEWHRQVERFELIYQQLARLKITSKSEF